MEVLLQNKIKNISYLPYFYLSEYAHFVKTTEKKEIIFFGDENGNTLVCKIWTNKFLKILQPIFPPLNSKGERLSKKMNNVF